MRMATLRNLISGVLYPRSATCIGCGCMRVDVLPWQLCSACAAALVRPEGPYCPTCGKPGWAFECPECAIRKPDALDGRLHAYTYSDTARRLIRALKYDNVVPAATALASGMAEAIPAHMQFDALVPVPLHKKRESVRGFNQARALCEALSLVTHIPVIQPLIRSRKTDTQTRLSREERASNVSGAFEATYDLSCKSILLVDDVCTTGATAIACANALKAQGAHTVILLTAARADEQSDD